MRNIQPVAGAVRVVNLPSEYAVRAWPGDREIDLLWIDGDHSADAARTDWQLWTPLVAQGGRVALHDATTHPGVMALAAWVESSPHWRLLNAAGTVKVYGRA
jgi:hypothetical protein